MLSTIVEVFHHKGKTNWPLVLVFVLVNLLVLYNAVFHDPNIGYDTSAYLEYIATLAEGRLPTSADTGEFFSPPLAFAPSAGFYAALQPHADSAALNPPTETLDLPNFLYYRLLYSIDDFALALSAKLLQLLNVIYSIGVTYLLLKLCDLLRPDHPWYKTLTLFLLGMLPVYYKTFAFVRAEPLMILLVVAGLYTLLAAYHRDGLHLRDAFWLGLIGGLGMLTRQWFLAAFLTLLIGLPLLAWQQGASRRRVLRLAGIYLLVAAALSAPFYVHLTTSEGSPLAFNREAQTQVPWSEYLKVDFSAIVEDPLRASLSLQFLPILYSEIWGDYWGYFTFYARDKESGRYMEGLFAANDVVTPAEAAAPDHPMETNRYTINSYLGRVNAVSILPTVVFAAGLGFGLKQLLQAAKERFNTGERSKFALITFFIVLSVAIYGTFLLLYTDDDATTVKASYLLHAAPFMALLAAEALLRLERRNAHAFQALLGVLGLVVVHNLPAMLTRHVL